MLDEGVSRERLSKMETITYTPIGVVRSPFTALPGMPLHTVAAQDVMASVEIDPAFEAGLKDLDDFSYLHLLVHMHQSDRFQLVVTPFLDDQPRGVFATRSPRHPNPIGLSLVRLVRIEGRVLHIAEVDLLDGTPVLDIKPYVPLFDERQAERIGWFATRAHRVHELRADDRFTNEGT